MTQKQIEFAARIERLRAAEEKEAALKASNRDGRPMNNPKGIEPTVADEPWKHLEVTGPIVGGFKTMGIGKYLEA